MDKTLLGMLREAERLRQNLKARKHARYIMEVKRYIEGSGFLTGNVLRGDASEEHLAFVTEMAAGFLEFFFNEKIGSLLRLSEGKKVAVCRRAYVKGLITEEKDRRESDDTPPKKGGRKK